MIEALIATKGVDLTKGVCVGVFLRVRKILTDQELLVQYIYDTHTLVIDND